MSRTQQAPNCLTENSIKWTTEYLTKKQADSKHKFSWRSAKCYEEMRKRLLMITGNRCAFCDGVVGVESRETIEHFKPKESFPDLAYEWSNLYPCCDMCQSNKLQKYEECLLKPDEEAYQFNSHFTFNYKTGELEPIKDINDVPCKKADITITTYGLNLQNRNKARIRELKAYNNEEDPNIDDFHYRYIFQ